MADLIVQKNEAITTLLFNRPDAETLSAWKCARYYAIA